MRVPSACGRRAIRWANPDHFGWSYTIRQMANDLNRSERTVKAALAELENAGLITRIRQGWNRANRIFLRLPDEVQRSSLKASITGTLKNVAAEIKPSTQGGVPSHKKNSVRRSPIQNNPVDSHWEG